MFNFEGKEFKSKSAVALEMLKEGKGRTEISKVLEMKYQTVHSVMKKNGLLASPKTNKKVKKPAKQAVENTEASNS